MTARLIAVDGPSGSGKSSVAKGVAGRFGYGYLDTGAMYRALTWLALDRGIDPADSEAVAQMLSHATIVSGTDPAHPTITVNDHDVSEPIRSHEVTGAVSQVSAVPAVREFLRALQRQEAEAALQAGSGIVVEGRDIGSEVLPDADVKVYLTADPAVRAARRHAEHSQNGQEPADVAETEAALRRRDELDSTREHSPLRLHEGATVVDATHLDLEQTIDAVCALVQSAGGDS